VGREPRSLHDALAVAVLAPLIAESSSRGGDREGGGLTGAQGLARRLRGDGRRAVDRQRCYIRGGCRRAGARDHYIVVRGVARGHRVDGERGSGSAIDVAAV